MKVFYNKKQNARSLNKLSPSADKPRLVVQEWRKRGLAVEIMTVRPASVAEISLAHDPKYVNAILGCRLKNGFGDINKEVAKSLPWTVGSFLSAAMYSYQNKETSFSPTSGFHHAKYSSAGGFCTFSGLTIAAIALHQKLGAKRIGILDLDTHAGDGTDDTLEKTGAIAYVEHYSLGYDDVDQYNNQQWLDTFAEKLKLRFSDCEIIFYQAGADCHIDDPFVEKGHFSTEQLLQRDQIVFKTFRELNIPLVVNLAGGYQNPISKILELHYNTAAAYCDLSNLNSSASAKDSLD